MAPPRVRHCCQGIRYHFLYRCSFPRAQTHIVTQGARDALREDRPHTLFTVTMHRRSSHGSQRFSSCPLRHHRSRTQMMLKSKRLSKSAYSPTAKTYIFFSEVYPMHQNFHYIFGYYASRKMTCICFTWRDFHLCLFSSALFTIPEYTSATEDDHTHIECGKSEKRRESTNTTVTRHAARRRRPQKRSKREEKTKTQADV